MDDAFDLIFQVNDSVILGLVDCGDFMLAILIKRIEVLFSGNKNVTAYQHIHGLAIFEKCYNRGPIIVCEFVSLITRQGAVCILKEVDHPNGTFVILFAMFHDGKLRIGNQMPPPSW